MKTGETVLGRFRLLDNQAAPADQWRFGAVDQVTMGPVEVVGPDRLASLRPGAREAFAQAQQLTDHAVVLSPTAAGQADGHPCAARPLTQGSWPSQLRLSAEAALAVLRGLAPAVAANAVALGGELAPEDLVIDQDGRVRLAPAGLVHPHSLARPDRHRAPERQVGAGQSPPPPTPEGALYGLGVIVFQALTGSPPVPARTQAELVDGQQRPRRASELIPDTPPALDAALAALLSPGPSARAAWAASLEADPPPPPLPTDWQVHARADTAPAPAPPQVQTLPTARAPTAGGPVLRREHQGGSGARDVPLDPWLVVVRAESLTERARRNVVALHDTDPAAVDEAASLALPLPLAGAADEAVARERARALEELGFEPMVVHRDAGTAGRLGAAALLLLAAGAALAAGVSALLLGIFGVGLILAGVLGVVSVGSAVIGVGLARRPHVPRAQLERGQRALARHTVHRPETTATWEALVQSRRALLAAPLPGVARRDLLDVADQVHEVLAQLDTSLDMGAVVDTDARRTLQGLQATIDTLQGAAVAEVANTPGRAAQLEAEAERRLDLARASASEAAQR